MKYFVITLLMLYCVKSDNTYFPPLLEDEWVTQSIEELNWNPQEIDILYNYLETNNSKAFILLKDGKIVLEKYFDDFTKDSIWYWASAGKTLTASLVGIAQYDGHLSINDKVSDYLGEGWTSAPSDKEDLITIRHQLTMATGLDYNTEFTDCIKPECLQYKSDAGSEWFYYNAPYTLLDKVIENATGQTLNRFFYQNIRNKIGMRGFWFNFGDTTEKNVVYFSNARSMARFGLMIMNQGNWDGTEIIKDKEYFNEMINTSQDLNKSYGYLWWLNGKESFMLPATSYVFNGAMMPEAPENAYAAMGKNGQCLHIDPKSRIVWVRMGEESDLPLFTANSLSNGIWRFINRLSEEPNSVKAVENYIAISPNPAEDYIEISFSNKGLHPFANSEEFAIYDVLGNRFWKSSINTLTPTLSPHNLPVADLRAREHRIDISHLPKGVYFVRIGNYTEKFVVDK